MTALARIIVSVSSLEAALPFYERVLRLRRTSELPGIVRLAGGRDLEVLLHERTPTPGEAGVAASFRVADVDAVTALAVQAGASVVEGPVDRPWGEREVVLHDVDGHVVCMVTPLR